MRWGRAVGAVLVAEALACNNARSSVPIGREAASAAPAPVATNGRVPTAASVPNESATTTASAPTPRSENGVRIVVAADDVGAQALIRTERLRAKREGRVLIVYVGATWCAPCRQFKEAVAAGRLDEQLAGVTLLAFDADRDAERLASAGYTFRFIPAVALPGSDGRASQSRQAEGHGGGAWRELVASLVEWRDRERSER